MSAEAKRRLGAKRGVGSSAFLSPSLEAERARENFFLDPTRNSILTPSTIFLLRALLFYAFSLSFSDSRSSVFPSSVRVKWSTSGASETNRVRFFFLCLFLTLVEKEKMFEALNVLTLPSLSFRAQGFEKAMRLP